jgi:predicted N-acyltransferase
MPDGREAIPVKVHNRIGDIAHAQWDACAGSDNPFLSHAFLNALEMSGTVAPETGWAPQHLTIEDDRGQVIACAPLYVKSHSYGEYVFDWSWADAFRRSGKTYYPKAQCAIPFTPVTGSRLLVRPDGDAPTLRSALLGAMLEITKRQGCSSLHVTFPTAEEWQHMGQMGMMQRVGQQFHWENDGYATFADFLATLSSRRRKDIRKEREKAQSQGLDLQALTGASITPAHWRAFHRFYLNTVDRKWAHAYLNEEFFQRMGAAMADRVLLTWAERDGKPVAGALNLIGSDTLFGRNWGCAEDHPFLHFELCYYMAIDFAIERGLKRVEAGAQGEHKIQRGYLPSPTYSAHWIEDARFRDAIARFLDQERDMVAEGMAQLSEHSPYRHDPENSKEKGLD